jgi:glycosyltransferase involved in cell wall biosynthesis
MDGGGSASASAGRLVNAGMAGGFDLRRHENLMFSPAMAQPKEIYVPTKTLLAPSLGQEAAGRVAAEALLNGIPPLVSDRGGLAETCNGAGFYLPIPPGITPGQAVPVAAEVVEPWIDLIERLEDDAEFIARRASGRWRLRRCTGRRIWRRDTWNTFAEFWASRRLAVTENRVRPVGLFERL